MAKKTKNAAGSDKPDRPTLREEQKQDDTKDKRAMESYAKVSARYEYALKKLA